MFIAPFHCTLAAVAPVYPPRSYDGECFSPSVHSCLPAQLPLHSNNSAPVKHNFVYTSRVFVCMCRAFVRFSCACHVIEVQSSKIQTLDASRNGCERNLMLSESGPQQYNNNNNNFNKHNDIVSGCTRRVMQRLKWSENIKLRFIQLQHLYAFRRARKKCNRFEMKQIEAKIVNRSKRTNGKSVREFVSGRESTRVK